MKGAASTPDVPASSETLFSMSAESAREQLESFKVMVAELERQLDGANKELARLRSVIACKENASATSTPSLTAADSARRSLSEPALVLHLRLVVLDS